LALTYDTADAAQPFGLMHQMWALAETSDADFLRDTISHVRLADELGYDSVWLAEHHYVRDAPFYSRLPDPELLIARLIPDTERIRLATGIKILYLDDPARAVERLRLLDLLSDRRVLFGLGQGSPDELGTATLSTDERRQRFRERLQTFTRYLEDGIVGDDLLIAPDVSIDPARAIWVGVRDPVSIALAAQLRTNFIVGEAEPAVQQAKLIERYRSSGGRGETRGARLVCIAERERDALFAARDPARRLFAAFSSGDYYQQAVGDGALPAQAPVTERELLERIEFAVGTPEMVTERLAEYVTVTGVDALNIVVHAPGMANGDAQRSLELFMAEVAPQLESLLRPEGTGDGNGREPQHGGPSQC
jgi:alkanesulfonate monooxygenase SsuD/methylene tetrahydromethanopterin reductase-like flavin-dependent oxidoreductase (luciferase family)